MEYQWSVPRWQNSTSAEEVARFQCLSPNPSWLASGRTSGHQNLVIIFPWLDLWWLKVGCVPYAVGKQPSMPLINLGRKWLLKWWWYNQFVPFSMTMIFMEGLYGRELHGDKKSPPFPPRTQCFVPISAATAVILLKLFPLPRLPRFYRGNQCKFLKSCPHYRRYRSKSENPFPITAVFTVVIPWLPRSGISCRSLLFGASSLPGLSRMWPKVTVGNGKTSPALFHVGGWCGCAEGISIGKHFSPSFLNIASSVGNTKKEIECCGTLKKLIIGLLLLSTV